MLSSLVFGLLNELSGFGLSVVPEFPIGCVPALPSVVVAGVGGVGDEDVADGVPVLGVDVEEVDEFAGDLPLAVPCVCGVPRFAVPAAESSRHVAPQ